MKNFWIKSFCLSCALLTALASPFKAFAKAPAAPLKSSLASNYFGYVLDSSLDFNTSWVDIQNTGIQIDNASLDDLDDGFADLQFTPEEFSFKFYNTDYNQFKVSVNGFISIGDQSEGIFENTNTALPSQLTPNNLIAAFWDDLRLDSSTLENGSIFYQVGGTAPDRYLIIEWVNLHRYGESDSQLTFEAILHENGDIILNYHTLNCDLTQSTVGIEDEDGIDGVEVFYHEAGLSSSSAIKIAYPPDGARVKLLPLFQSDFIINNISNFQINVKNSGTVEDIYDLAYTAEGAADWEVTFLNTDGQPLSDHNDNGIPDTGLVPVKSSAAVIIHVHLPYEAPIGSYTRLSITASSQFDPSKQFTAIIQAAVPASFLQAFNNDNQTNLLFTTSEEQESELASTSIIDNLPALVKLSTYQYMLAWYENHSSYSNLVYAVFSSLTQSKIAEFTLADNSISLSKDVSPALTITSDNKVGLAFVRAEKVDGQRISNVYLATLKTNGTPLSLQRITQNTNADIIYESPSLVSTPSNNFVLAWSTKSNSGEKMNIETAVRSSSGSVIKEPTAVTFDLLNEQTARFSQPVLSALAQQTENDAVLVFTGQAVETSTYKLLFTKIDSSTGTIQPITVVDGISGQTPDVAEFDNGNIMVSFTNLETQQISYLILPSDSGSPFSVDLTAPISMPMNHSSIAIMQDGYTVLTWGEESGKNLFYALIGMDGNILTPPMIFHEGIIPINYYYPLTGSMTNAEITDPIRLYLPIIIFQ